jgi:hypothetical protein
VTGLLQPPVVATSRPTTPPRTVTGPHRAEAADQAVEHGAGTPHGRADGPVDS